MPKRTAAPAARSVPRDRSFAAGFRTLKRIQHKFYAAQSLFFEAMRVNPVRNGLEPGVTAISQRRNKRWEPIGSAADQCVLFNCCQDFDSSKGRQAGFAGSFQLSVFSDQ
jgi:hypothetical protein